VLRVKIRLGHSPDPDDAFMAWPIATGRVDTRGLEIELVPDDIQRLNELAFEGRLEVTAASMHAYAHLRDTYELLPVGASLAHHRLDLRVLPRVERLEGQVLQLPLHRMDPEPVRERRVDLERLA
jgi:hypothetical protein